MSKIFDQLEKNISDKKNSKREKEEKLKKLWKKYYTEEGKIQKELKINNDIINLEKFVKKHITDQKVIKVINDHNNYLKVENTISLPDGYSTTTVSIEFKNSKKPLYSIKDHDLENYKHSKESYVVHVKLLGDPDIDYVITENVMENKIFKIDDREKAYEYFSNLFQKHILYLDVD